MNILMLCYEFPPVGGGGAQVVQGLVRELTAAGHNIDLVTMGFRKLPRQETMHNVRIFRIPGIRLRATVCSPLEMLPYLLLSFPFVLSLVRKNRYDLNHTHFIMPDGLLSILLKKFTGLPYAITAHGSDVPGYNPDRFKILHRILLPVWKRVVEEAAIILCPSETICGLILDSDSNVKTEIIPNGINISRFKPRKVRKDRILVVTRMFERKGVQYLLEALSTMDIQQEVNIVGDGPYLPKLKAMSDQYGLKVNFKGFLSNQGEEFRELLENSRYFVFTSEAENFPVVLLEAMAAGLAIITTDGTGCCEVVGDSGITVPIKSAEAIRGALIELLKNPDQAETLGVKARQRVEKYFTWDVVTQKTIAMYERERKK